MYPAGQLPNAAKKILLVTRQDLRKIENAPICSLVMITKPSMLHLLGRAILILLAIGAVAWLPAADTAIGMAVTNGSFQVDHSRVWGNTTLFDGSIIETAKAPSQLQLNGGAQMRLSSDSRVRVYQRKLILESGYGQLESATDYEVEARSLRITAATPHAVARIRLDGDRKVMVAAVRGVVRVRNASGLLVANVEAGNSLDLEPQPAGAAAPTRLSGCLLAKSGKIIVVEQTTNVIIELQGLGLEKEVGNHVEITGVAADTNTSVPGASQLIRVAGLKQVSKGGCSAVAKKIGATAAAGAAAGAATATGISAGTLAVIGGVAAVATVGGLAAVGSLPGQSDTPPAASR